MYALQKAQECFEMSYNFRTFTATSITLYGDCGLVCQSMSVNHIIYSKI